MHEQSSLGPRKEHRMPDYGSQTKIARVTGTKDYHAVGRIEAIFLDYGQPLPIWIVGQLDREPVPGDEIVVGYLEGRKDAPYMIGFMKNGAYTTNFLVVKKDKIKLQLPIFGIDTKDSAADKDVRGHLLDESKQAERAYIEVTPDHALISFPTSDTGATPPATITITASEVTIDHPGAIKHHGGTQGVARMGDTVTVNVGGTNYTGTITSASEKTLID